MDNFHLASVRAFAATVTGISARLHLRLISGADPLVVSPCSDPRCVLSPTTLCLANDSSYLLRTVSTLSFNAVNLEASTAAFAALGFALPALLGGNNRVASVVLVFTVVVQFSIVAVLCRCSW